MKTGILCLATDHYTPPEFCMASWIISTITLTMPQPQQCHQGKSYLSSHFFFQIKKKGCYQFPQKNEKNEKTTVVFLTNSRAVHKNLSI